MTEKMEQVASTHAEVVQPEVDDNKEIEIYEAPDVDLEEDFRVGVIQILAFVALVLGFGADIFLGAAVSAIVTVINEDLGPSTDAVWIVSGNYVAVSSLSPFVGRLGDIYGRRWVLLAGNLVGAVACIVSATATSVNAVIVGSILIGVGSCGHQAAWSCVSEILPRNWRPLAVAGLDSGTSLFSVTGALIAFAMVDHSTWRWVYWTALMMNGLAFGLILFCYRPINQYIHEVGKTKTQQLMSLDWVGTILFSAGFVPFLLGLTFGGSRFPWKSAGTLAPLLVGLVVLVILGIWEAHTTNPYAIFPHNVMRIFRGFVIPLVLTFLVGIVYFSTLILWPQQIQVLYTQDPITIGLYSMSLGLGGGTLGLIIGYLFKRFNHGRLILACIVIMGTLLSGLQATLTPGLKRVACFLVTLLGAFTSGTTIACNTMVQLFVPHEHLGVAVGIAISFRNVGGSVATTIYSTILANDLKKHLGRYISNALLKAGLSPAQIPAVTLALATGDTTSPVLANLSPEVLQAGERGVKLGHIHAFRLVYLVSIAFGVPCICLALLTRNFGQLMTKAVDVKLSEKVALTDHEGHTGGHILRHDEHGDVFQSGSKAAHGAN